MKFSTRTIYGLKAVLVLAGRYGEGSLSASQIAKKEGISVAYLEQILNRLKCKGLIKSMRGPQGGYILTKKPSEITLKNIFEILETTDFPIHAKVSEQADESSIANIIFWKKFETTVKNTLSELTLKSLIDEARRHKKSNSSGHSTHFQI